MDKPKTYNEWHSSLKDFEGLRHANCCKISYEAGQQSRQAEIDEKDKRINRALNLINNWWHPDLDQKLFVEALGRALRGDDHV